MFASVDELATMVDRLDERRLDIAQMRELLVPQLLASKPGARAAFVEMLNAEDALLRESTALLHLIGRIAAAS